MKPHTKVVGKRVVRERVDPHEALAWQDSVAQMLAWRPVCDKGVFRFRSFEEADEWMMRQMARKSREHRPPKTSPESPPD